MIYASIAAVIVALLGWDGWRRSLTLRRAEYHKAIADVSHRLTINRGDHVDLATEVHQLKRDLDKLRADGIVTDKRCDQLVEELQADRDHLSDCVREWNMKASVPVDVSEFRAELMKHEQALFNVIKDARETFATKADLLKAEQSLRSGQGAIATSGTVGNGRMRMPLR